MSYRQNEWKPWPWNKHSLPWKTTRPTSRTCRLINPAKKWDGTRQQDNFGQNQQRRESCHSGQPVEMLKVGTRVFQKHTGKRQAHIHKLRHCRILPLHNGKPAEESHCIRKEAHTSLQARHKNHHARFDKGTPWKKRIVMKCSTSQWAATTGLKYASWWASIP